MAYDLIEASYKIDYLENIMAQLAYNVNQVSVNISRFSHEMQEFKGEMRVFRNKMDTVIRDMQQDTAESKQRTDSIIHNMQQEAAESQQRLDSVIRDMRQEAAESQQRLDSVIRDMRQEAAESQQRLDSVIRDMRQEAAESQQRLDSVIRDMQQDTAEFKRKVEQDTAEFKQKVEQDTAQFKQNTDATIRDMQQDTAEFKRKVEQDTADLKQELKAESRKLNQHVASVSDKMGTMAEDMVAPSIPRILKEAVNCEEEPKMIGVRIRKGLSEGRSQEYDVVAVCGNYVVINETKSKLRPGDLPAFRELMQQAHDFFPEYVGYQFIGALATFYVDPSLITAGERQGFIMLGVIDGLMEILNREGFTPTTF